MALDVQSMTTPFLIVFFRKTSTSSKEKLLGRALMKILVSLDESFEFAFRTVDV